MTVQILQFQKIEVETNEWGEKKKKELHKKLLLPTTQPLLQL